MKKFLKATLCAFVCAIVGVGFAACTPTENGGEVTVYAPDGAPALSIARLIAQNSDDVFKGYEVEYHVVSADDILGHVSFEDETKNADLCILPVNDAVKALGSGESYQLLGTVTHGNLYLLTDKSNAELTTQNVATELAGKNLGVVQLPKFPGLMTKVVLAKYSLTSSVTLEAKTATSLTGDDYYVVPEPAASRLVGNANLNLKYAGDLQTLYGAENGYPQAVLVAKTSFIAEHPNFIKQFISSFAENKSWLTASTTTAQEIIDAITSALPEGTSPTFKATDLTEQVLQHCGINFVTAAESKAEILNFMTELNAVASVSYGLPQDAFFYAS